MNDHDAKAILRYARTIKRQCLISCIDRMNVDHMVMVHSRVRDWLMTEWDPIGVSAWPEAFDEYYGYVRDVADLLMVGASEEELARHLLAQERESMGLRGDPNRASRAAARLKKPFDELPKDL